MAITYLANVFRVNNTAGTGTVATTVNGTTTTDAFGQTISTGTLTGTGTSFTTELELFQEII